MRQGFSVDSFEGLKKKSLGGAVAAGLRFRPLRGMIHPRMGGTVTLMGLPSLSKRLRMGSTAASFIVVLLACAESAHAQPQAVDASSVERRAARSSLIVRAVVEEVTGPIKDEIHNRHYQTVSVRVLETVKGKQCDRLQFVDDVGYGPFAKDKLRQDRQEVLLFLDHWTRREHFSRSAGAYAYTRFPYIVEGMALLTPTEVRFGGNDLSPLTANLTKISTPEQLLGAIKGYLKNCLPGQPVRDVTIDLPKDLRGGYEWGSFTFPADAAPDHPKSVVESPAAGFAAIRDRFAAKPPGGMKPSYGRKAGGYVGVYALELMAADCDVIVRGGVDDSFYIGGQYPTGPACGARVRVTEALKGEAPGHLNVYVTEARDLQRLQQDRQEVVLFLRTRALSGSAAVFGYQTRAYLWDDSAIVLAEREAEALFSDLTWNREPDAILKRLRAAIERELRKKGEGGIDGSSDEAGHVGPPVFDAYPPASIAAGSSIAGNPYAVIYLPVDRELEANSRDKWAASESKDLRWLAARTLIYFKSDKNAALLRTLLADEATWEEREMNRLLDPMYPWLGPEYLVRWEAWQVLNGWGYETPKPAFRVGRRR